MAASAEKEEGYECDFVSIPDDSLHCRICLSVARDPRQHSKCGQLYCYTCLETYKQKNTSCPYCKELNANFFEDNRSHRQILSLIVRCSQEQDGCSWQGELRYLQDHSANKCDYREVNCPLKCDITMKYITLNHHIKIECPNRLIKCTECGEEGPYWSITTDHKEECLYILEKCPVPGCDIEMCSVLMTFHLQTECEYSLVECKYRGVGCTAILTRRHMEEHDNNDRYHLKLLTQSHTSLKEKYQQLETFNQHLLTKYNKLQDSVTSLLSASAHYFSTFKISFKALFDKSKTFFATPQTYRFKAEFRHLIWGMMLFNISVIEGENDSNLDWPFSGTVIIEVLNPMKDKDHINIPVHIESQGRPGYSELKYYDTMCSVDAIAKYKYKEDIYVRFTVISNLCKPWLIVQQ